MLFSIAQLDGIQHLNNPQFSNNTFLSRKYNSGDKIGTLSQRLNAHKDYTNPKANKHITQFGPKYNTDS